MARRGHARRRGEYGGLVWLASLAALALSGWLVWRYAHGGAEMTTRPQKADDAAEVTHEERRNLDELLRRKSAEHAP